jgi:hypothetical protein
VGGPASRSPRSSRSCMDDEAGAAGGAGGTGGACFDGGVEPPLGVVPCERRGETHGERGQ